MAKYFLGSVGKAEAFKRDENGNLQLAFVSKTLTDSGLNISTTKDDIRAGEGAPVLFSFYHDANVEITLTDVLWKPEYLEAQLGANFESGNEDYITREVEFTSGEATISAEPYPRKAPVPCGEEYLIWAAPKGSDEWKLVSYNESDHKVTLPGASGKYCVRFLGLVDSAKEAEITSSIIPQELFLIITAPIFAGDACAASKGKAAGHITFEVPRFQLNGAQEFSMNMSSNQTMSLAGTALASTSYDCDANGGKLLRIIEVIDNRNWKDDVEGLIVDEESKEVGDTPSVYAELKDGHLKKVDNDDLTFTPALDGSGHFEASKTYTIKLKGTEITTEAIIA